MEDVTRYFDDDPEQQDIARRVQVTDYADAHRMRGGWKYQYDGYNDLTEYLGNGCWWLRSLGYSSEYGTSATTVEIIFGNVDVTSGYNVNDRDCVVRPAIWVDALNAKIVSGQKVLFEQEGVQLAEKQVIFSGKEKNVKEAKVGDIVIFGAYEQDNISSNGMEPIEWFVLDQKDGKLLLLSKYALDCKGYNEGWEETNWENCTLRNWLNNEFYNTAFSEVERTNIAVTFVVNVDNLYYGTKGGNNTYDKIFLLSIEEMLTYFETDPCEYDSARQVQVTEYTKAKGGWTSEEEKYYNNGRWWLRSSGATNFHAAEVRYNGYVDSWGYCEGISGFHVVRPVLWINVGA